MNHLFENRIAVDVPEDTPMVMPTIHSVTRWALIVIRANGIDFEVLSELYETENVANEQATWHGSRWQNVKVKVVSVTVHIPLDERE